MSDEVLEEVAIAIYRAFARVTDPEFARRRWVRLRPAIRDQYRDEARAAIDTYRACTQGKRR